MKIHRLLGILAVLLREQTAGQKVTAPQLAERFEVSRRTISRDIEALCLAGFPIVTEQGRGGGLSLAPGYRLDKQVLTEEERMTLTAALSGLESVSAPNRHAVLREKLSLTENSTGQAGQPLIDLSSFYQGSLTEKLAVLQEAIRKKQLVAFRYYAEKGESDRRAEPYHVVFQWGDWYLFARCLEREDFRMFKLSRLWELKLEPVSFSPVEIPPERLDFNRVWKENYRFCGLFDPREKYRLVEEYGPECFTTEPDGRLKFSVDFTYYHSMLSWALSFGDRVEVISPPELREELKRQGEIFLSRYSKQDS